MKGRLHIPIRVRFMLTFLSLATAVVGLMTFSTANLFRDDKQAYINGLTSMVALGMAEEARATLAGYHERVQLYARLLLENEAKAGEFESVSQAVFDEFPELVAVSVGREGRDDLEALNLTFLELAGLSRADVLGDRNANLMRAGALSPGEVFVRNTTLTAELPCFTLSFLQPIDDDGASAFVSAVLQTKRLQELTERFTAYTQSLYDSERSVLAHSDPALVASRSRADLLAQMNLLGDAGSAGLTQEYERDGVEMIGGFAGADFGEVIAAAEIPRSAAHLASRRVVQRSFTVAAILLVVAVLTGILWAHRITRPMERLTDATRRIGTGDFEVQVAVDSADEIGLLAGSFNQMTSELKKRDADLRHAHAQLVQSEKMAAFGQLGAGIAHEVKNPLAGILGCVQLAMDDVEPGGSVHDDLQLVERETRRCKSIIDNLLRFARQEKAEMESTDLNVVIANSLALVNHQLELNDIWVHEDIEESLPTVHGNGNQLQQVFVNLLVNAEQAMHGTKGSVTVSAVRSSDGDVELRFSDTGPGIPEEIRSKLFDPFFTTKPPGEGTGLGLSVSYGIIKDHNGGIAVESEVGKGTTFVIVLPAERTDMSPEILEGSAETRQDHLVPA